MKMRSGLGCLVAAVTAVSFVGLSHAADLRWDSDGAAGGFGTDGSGNWDLATPLWNDTPATTNTAWVQGRNAIFGNPANTQNITNAAAFNISLMDDIVVQDLHINTSSTGSYYNFDAPNFNSLTINGNVYKNTGTGQVKFDLLAGPFVLGNGDHVFALRDTGGDIPEMQINANISGAGGMTIDNRLTLNGVKESWGTLSTTGINSYTGQTNIKYGRLVISQSAGLGSTSAGTVISEAGTLSIGGPGVTAPQNLTISEPITITRNTYTGGDATDGGAFSHYGAAVVATNGTGTTTFNGAFVVDSTDARIAANTGTLVISSDIQKGPNVTTPMLSVTGDFAGFVHLTGNNTALTGGVSIIDAVQLDVDNDNQIGGPTAPLNFVGGGTFHPVNGYLTNFGSHVINNSTFNGGIFVDAGKTFTIDQALGRALGDDNNRVGSLGKRGTGTLNINSAVNLRGGQTFWDAGVVNVNAAVELANLHLRSPTVNINAGGSITTVAGFNSFGQDSTGTNGGPDIAVININGGKLIQTSGDDFNISDNPNTKGTINLNSGELTTGGLTFVAKASGAVGTIVQNGGKLTINRDGNFAFVLGDGRDNRTPVGNYTFNAGTFRSEGEVYVGEGGTGTGNWTQAGSGTNAEIDHWFVIGREGGKGTVTLSNGAKITKTRGGTHVEIDAGSANGQATASTMTVDGATFDIIDGELRVGTGGGADGTLNIRNGAVVNANDWIGIGRDNGKGVVNLEGGSLNKGGGNNISIGWKDQSNGSIVQTGGTLNVTSGETWIGEGGQALINSSGGSANILRLDVGHAGGGNGELRVSGGSNFKATGIVIGANDSVNGVINLSGGSLTATSITTGNSSGSKTVNWTGGNLAVGAYNVGVGLNNTGTGRLTPGGGNAIGTTAITGNYTQSATARMAIELASSGVDTVTSTGTVTLDGPLELSVLAGYDPAKYQPLSFITAGNLVGHFATVEGLQIAQNKALAVTYTGTSALVQAATPGDLTLDGAVNFNDLVGLAQNYNQSGRTWATGDFNGDGQTKFEDLVTLAQFYNKPASFEADWAYALSITPEPTSLLALGLVGVIGSVRNRRR